MTNDKEIILKVDNLTKTYTVNGTIFYALKNINFELHKGETIGIVGSNGAGKSTLLKLLAEIIPPTKGEVTCNGTILSILEIGTGFHPDLSGYENIYFNAALLGMSKKEIDEKIDSIIEFSGIKEFINEPIKSYSNGMYLRLAMAIALHVNYAVILLDEVISVGDAEFSTLALQRIKQQIKSGKSCILISHDLQSISSLCDNCIVLNKGEINFIGKPYEAINLYLADINDKLKQKTTFITEHEKVKFISATSKKEIYQLNEPIAIEITYEKKCVDDIDIVIKVKNHQGYLLSDCEIYRPNYSQKNLPEGVYNTVCTLPENLFDNGTYSVDVLFGDKVSTLLNLESILSFKAEISDWEKHKKWNEGDDAIPFRPQCNWETLMLNK